MSTRIKKHIDHDETRISKIFFDGHQYLAEVKKPKEYVDIQLTKEYFDQLENHLEHYEFVKLEIDDADVDEQGILHPHHIRIIDEPWEWR